MLFSCSKSKNKNKILIFLITFLVFSLCILCVVKYYRNADYTTNKSGAKTLYIEKEYDILVDISDINVLKNLVDQIVIAKVDKIEGCTNYSEGLGMYTRINTLGNIEILQVLKGNINVDAKVPFIRGGGTISYNDYEKGVSEKDKQKLKNSDSNYELVKEKAKDDIDIEEGKIYLMFLHYDIYNQRYEIVANQYGLREYDINSGLVTDNSTSKRQTISELGL